MLLLFCFNSCSCNSFDFFQDQAAKDMKKLEEKEKEKNLAK